MFFRANAGLNCPADTFLEAEMDCRTAALQIGLPYIGSITDSNAPSGCWHYGHNSVSFNTIVNPTATHPDNFRNKGGVCLGGMYEDMFYMLSVLNQKIDAAICKCCFCKFVTLNLQSAILIGNVQRLHHALTINAKVTFFDTSIILKSMSIII